MLERNIWGNVEISSQKPTIKLTITLEKTEGTIQSYRQHWAQDTKQRQSRVTGNIGHKTQNKDNPELQATLGTRHRTKMNNVEITTQKTKKMSITDPTTTRGVCTGLVLMKSKQLSILI